MILATEEPPLASAAPVNGAGRPVATEKPPLAPNPPGQVVFPLDAPEKGDETEDRGAVSRFAWEAFVALNWPAVADKRGVPDATNRFRSTSGPTVWGTWKTPDELYPLSGAPKSWGSLDADPVISVIDKDRKRVQYPVKDTAKATAGRPKFLGELSSVNQATSMPAKVDGNGSPLVDQRGQIVRYETRINKTAYEFISAPENQYYLQEKLGSLTPGKGEYPVGSIHVKAAWMEIHPKVPQPERFYRTWATAIVGWNGTEPKTDTREVGLVGFHIVAKVPTRASWVWATFEHVDNLAPAPGATLASFNDPSEPQTLGARPSHVIPGSPFPTTRVQVVRRTPINEKIVPVNEWFRTHPELKNTVWTNYQLVGVQWARERNGIGQLADEGGPDVLSRMLPKVEPVANVTLETHLQDRSCLGCHGPSHTRKFPFVFYPNTMAIPKKP